DVTGRAGTVLSEPRVIEVFYVGGPHIPKFPLLTKLKRAFGRRLRIYGFFGLRHNLYLNIMHRYGGWIRPLSFPERVRLHQRSKIGINIHWNDYGLGNERL